MAGYTPQGFSVPSIAELRAGLEKALREEIDQGLDTSAETVFGQVVGIFSAAQRTLWEGLHGVYLSRYEKNASGVALEELLAPVQRLQASQSTALVNVLVDPGTYAAGSLVLSVVGSPSKTFSNVGEVVNETETQNVVSGVLFRAADFGPVVANAGTLSVIAQPLSGFISATNPNDASLGREKEKDSDYRRRAALLRERASGSSLPGIYAALFGIEGVVGVGLFENNRSTFNAGLNLPPHTVEAVVYDGTPTGTNVPNHVIAQTLLDSVAGGIRTAGQIQNAIADKGGTIRDIQFSRPSTVPVYLRFDVVVSNLRFPSDGVQQIKSAATLFGDSNFSVGDAITASRFSCPVYEISGVDRIEAVFVGLETNPDNTGTLAISARQLPDFDTTRVDVRIVGRTP